MKGKRIFAVLLALVFVLTSIQMTLAKDVSGYFDKGVNVQPNSMVKGKFEKSNDTDCYTFVSGGGTYKVKIYSKTDDYVEVSYGEFMMFSAAAGDPPRYQMGSYHTTYAWPDTKSNGWYVSTITLSKFKKSNKVGLSFKSEKKGSYKFKVIGNNAPAPGTPKLKVAKGGKKNLTVKWGAAKKAKGYQIQYSKDKNFSSSTKVTIKKKVTSKTLKVKKAGKYYVRVRAYKIVADERCYSKWSKAKATRVK